MPDTFKLRRFTGPQSKTFTPEEIELIDYNFWSIEGALNSLGASTPVPGGGTTPVIGLSHHSLQDLTDGDDHTQYLLLAGRATAQVIRKNLSLAGDDGNIRARWLPGSVLAADNAVFRFYPSGGNGVTLWNFGGGATGRIGIGLSSPETLTGPGASLQIFVEASAAGISVVGGAGGGLITASTVNQGSFNVDAVGRTTISSGVSQASGFLAKILNLGNNASVNLALTRKSTQTGSLLEARDESENPLTKIGPDGSIDLGNNSGSTNIKTAGANSKKTILLMAAGGKGTTTSGCGGPTQVEAATNKNNYWALEFDTTTEENAFWLVQMPDNYDASTLTAKFMWTNAGGASTETVRWGIKARSYADDDAIDQAFGTEVTVDDTWLAQNDVHNSPVSSAITIGGSPAGGRWVIFNVARKVASDNLAGDARLLSVQIEYGINSYGD